MGEPHRVIVVPKNCCDGCLLKKLESVKWEGGTVREYAVHFVASVQGNKSICIYIYVYIYMYIQCI